MRRADFDMFTFTAEWSKTVIEPFMRGDFKAGLAAFLLNTRACSFYPHIKIVRAKMKKLPATTNRNKARQEFDNALKGRDLWRYFQGFRKVNYPLEKTCL
jgi:hypothetical protein